MHRIVILGAGFGGLAASRELAKQQVDVTLVDKNNFQTFQPLLYEVATAGLDPDDIAYPVRAVIGGVPNINFRLGTVTGVDWQDRVVCFARNGNHDSSRIECADDLPFDSLVVATGAGANYFNVTGASQNSHPLYTLDDARHLRNHILLRLEEADGQTVHASDGTLNFVVVGGGPTGVEVSGAIVELLDVSIARDGLRFDRAKAHVILIDGFDHLLTPFKPSAQRYAETTLRDRTVELLLGHMVSRVGVAEVQLKDGTEIPTRTVVWAGGVTCTGTIASTLGASTNRTGRLMVDSSLRVTGHQDCYAIGDAALIPRTPGSEESCPQLAQVAIQTGRHVAAEILAGISGTSIRPFRYVDKGIMATIGRRAAVAQLRKGVVLRGTIGWLAWFGLHLVYLVGFGNRVTVIVNWAWRYLNWTSGPRVIIGDNAAGP
jgi:NADH dehydrogenase